MHDITEFEAIRKRMADERHTRIMASGTSGEARVALVDASHRQMRTEYSNTARGMEGPRYHVVKSADPLGKDLVSYWHEATVVDAHSCTDHQLETVADCSEVADAYRIAELLNMALEGRAPAAAIAPLTREVEHLRSFIRGQADNARKMLGDDKPKPADDMVPCPAKGCGHGICGLCGTEGRVLRSVADAYGRNRK